MNIAVVSLAITSAVGVIGWIFTYQQLRTARQTLALGTAKAIPQIGTEVRIDERQVNPKGFPAFYYITASIYNAGEFAASRVKGNCRIHSATGSIRDQDIPIDREFLDNSSPYQLESYRLVDAAGSTIDLFPTQIRQNIRFNVYIEFEFSGLPSTNRQHYDAKYEYDPKTNQMVRI